MLYEESVTAWLEQLKAGHSSVAGKVWQRYVEQLVRLARRKLRGSPRRVADEEDVALAAFDAFLRGVKDDRFARLDDRDDLWQLLVMLTERKAIGQLRDERAIKRGGGQIRGESVFGPDGDKDSVQDGLEQVADPDPTPEFAVEMTEEVRVLLERLDESQQRIALGKLEGYTNQELADRLGISLRAVERKLNIIRRRWDAEPE